MQLITNDTSSSTLHDFFSKKQDLEPISALITHLDNGDRLGESCRCSLKNNPKDLTRCGVVAESFLNCIYFPSEEELGGNIAIHHFDMALLQKKIKLKSLVCKIIWQVWEKELFESDQTVGKVSMPAYDHTFLLDLAPAKISENAERYGYIIQAAFDMYGGSVQPVTSEFIWERLKYLNKFDRNTVLNGEELSNWINDSVFLNRNEKDSALESFEGKKFIGQLVSFTGYSYNPEAAMSRLHKIKNFVASNF